MRQITLNANGREFVLVISRHRTVRVVVGAAAEMFRKDAMSDRMKRQLLLRRTVTARIAAVVGAPNGSHAGCCAQPWPRGGVGS